MTDHRPSRPVANPARGGGPDRITVALSSLTAFLLVLALLGTQLSHSGSKRVAAQRSILVRRIYKTTVIERVLPAGVGGPGGTSVAQSVSGSSPGSLPAAALVTRTS